MTWFGDIDIPWLTDKDTSITKDVIEKNFVDEPPQVYELTPNLEAGTYTLILNEKYHNKNESMSEQEDAVLSMVPRHGTEFPFAISGDKGYALVESASVTTTPTLEIRNGDVEIRFLDIEKYRSAVKTKPKPLPRSNFNTSSDPIESIIAFPSNLDIIDYNSDYTVSTEEGNIDLYVFSDRTVFEYNELDNVYESQQIAICRLFNSDGERLYSDSKVIDNNSYISNGLIKNIYLNDRADLEYYDGEWNDIGSSLIPFNDGYASTNENDEIECQFVNGNRSSLYRGFSVVRYDFTDESSFEFEPYKSFTKESVEDYYSHYVDEDGHDLILLRTSNDGNFFNGDDVFGIENLFTSNEYTVYVGVVPENIPVSDYARYVYNFGNRERTFTQK